MSNPADRSPTWDEGRRISTRARSSSSLHGHIMPIERLTDDLLVEILSRVPASSLCRFKFVSKRWLGLIDHPDHRKKLPQPLAGFFYNSTTSEGCFTGSALHFVNASGQGRPFICPSLAFLPSHRRLDLLDCCHGLLLCPCWYDSSIGDDKFHFQYIVCNPAMEEWAVLPDPGRKDARVAGVYLGFDPAVSSHFHVFMLLVDCNRLIGVAVYSSNSGRWIHKEMAGLDDDIRISGPESATLLNGYLHFLNRTIYGNVHHRWWKPCVAAVDMQGDTWSNFDTPRGLRRAFIQNSLGCLHYAGFHDHDDTHVQLEVYALKDYAKKEWILKHRVEAGDVEEFKGVTQTESYFQWIAIDPECNSIFFVDGSEKTLRRYDMGRRQVTELQTLGEGDKPYLSYVPLYSELESLCK